MAIQTSCLTRFSPLNALEGFKAFTASASEATRVKNNCIFVDVISLPTRSQ